MATRKTATKAPAEKASRVKKATAVKSPGKTSEKVAVKKTASTKAAKAATAKRVGSLSKAGKDPSGGLTAEGRRVYHEQTGGHLRPGVKGIADTAEKKRRKGSFLTRHFTTPPGPVVKDGKPTRQALQAAAWGEPVPKTLADEKKLAAKGRKLLQEAKSM